MSAPTLMVGATLPGSDRDVWTGEVGSLQWASRQALGAHQRALGALIAVIGSREITAGVEPAHRNGKVATLTVGLSHDVSTLLGIGRHLGSQPRANTSISGLAVTVYAGTTFTMPDGTQPNPFPRQCCAHHQGRR